MWDQIILITCGLIMKDDIEVIDAYRVMKFDTFSHWLFSNMIWYGQLVIEQQKEEARVLNFVPAPFKLLWVLKQQREFILAKRLKETENEIKKD